MIFGYIEDWSHDSISVIVKLWENNAQNSLADTVHVAGKATWSFNFPLANGSNRARLAAYAANGDSLAGTSLLLRAVTAGNEVEEVGVVIEQTQRVWLVWGGAANFFFFFKLPFFFFISFILVLVHLCLVVAVKTLLTSPLSFI